MPSNGAVFDVCDLMQVRVSKHAMAKGSHPKGATRGRITGMRAKRASMSGSAAGKILARRRRAW